MRGFIRESESKLPVSTLSRREKQKRGLVKRARFLVLFGPLPDCSNCFHKIIHILYVCGCCCDVSFMSVFFPEAETLETHVSKFTGSLFQTLAVTYPSISTAWEFCCHLCLSHVQGRYTSFVSVRCCDVSCQSFSCSRYFQDKAGNLRVCCIKRCRQTFNARCRIPKLSNSNCLRILLPLMLVSTTG